MGEVHHAEWRLPTEDELSKDKLVGEKDIFNTLC